MRFSDIVDVILLMIVGFVFHVILPGISLADGMKPDFSLAALFTIILLKKDWKLVIISAFIMGIFTSVTSNVESGQWVNLIEKMITGGLMFILVNRCRDYCQNDGIYVCIVSVVGTIISGAVFAILAACFTDFTPNLQVAIIRVFLAAIILNIVVTYVLYSSMKFGERLCSDFST